MSDLSNHPDFSDLARLIDERRTRVARIVNSELVDLYWELGKRIHHQIEQNGWGRGTVTELAGFLSIRSSGARGFSASNLWRMRQFYETWQDVPEKLATLLRELPAEMKGHFKDSYVLDFLDLPPSHSEQDLRKGLVRLLVAFLRELGRDFTFIGEEYPIQVGTRDGFIDLLFFHRELNCLVALELKITAFDPAHLGQLNFYLEALDRDVRKAHENPSIGILLCASKDDEVVEYALSRSLSPALVAEYQTKLPDKALLQAKLHEFLELETQETSN